MINIYFATGTVATGADHSFSNKKIPQLFRNNCTIQDVAQIMNKPTIHLPDYKNFKNEQKREDNVWHKHNRGDSDRNSVLGRPDSILSNGSLNTQICTEEEALRNSLLAFDEEIVVISRMRNDILSKIHDLDIKRLEVLEERMRKQVKEKEVKFRRQSVVARREAALTRKKKGVFHEAEGFHIAEIEEILGKEVVRLVAMGGEATIVLYANGTWGCTSGIPLTLYHLLNPPTQNIVGSGGLKLQTPKPKIVALGSDDRFFIEFKNGKSQWNISDSCGDYCDNLSDLLLMKTGGKKVSKRRAFRIRIYFSNPFFPIPFEFSSHTQFPTHLVCCIWKIL